MDAPLSSGAAPHKTEARQESYPKSLRDWREFDDEPEEGEAAIAEMEPEAPPSPPPARVGGLEAPATLEEVAERLSRATTREEICRPLVQFMARYFGRAAMLAVLPDRTRVLDAAGEGVSAVMAREFSLPAGLPSLFEPLRSGKSFHLGPVGALHPGTRLFFAAVGGASIAVEPAGDAGRTRPGRATDVRADAGVSAALWPTRTCAVRSPDPAFLGRWATVESNPPPRHQIYRSPWPYFSVRFSADSAGEFGERPHAREAREGIECAKALN